MDLPSWSIRLVAFIYMVYSRRISFHSTIIFNQMWRNRKVSQRQSHWFDHYLGCYFCQRYSGCVVHAYQFRSHHNWSATRLLKRPIWLHIYNRTDAKFVRWSFRANACFAVEVSENLTATTIKIAMTASFRRSARQSLVLCPVKHQMYSNKCRNCWPIRRRIRNAR